MGLLDRFAGKAADAAVSRIERGADVFERLQEAEAERELLLDRVGDLEAALREALEAFERVVTPEVSYYAARRVEGRDYRRWRVALKGGQE
jgi:N-glycosylase/DNA lyase